MVRTNKKFDCVGMKNAVQQQLHQEYELHKKEFTSYVEFINSKADKSDDIRLFRERIARSKIRQTFKLTGQNRTEAAKILQIGERTLYRKIKEYGL